MRFHRAAYSALALAAFVATGATARSQNGDAPAGVFRLSNARGPIRPVELAPFKGEVSSEILAGPTNGLDSAYIIYFRRVSFTTT